MGIDEPLAKTEAAAEIVEESQRSAQEIMVRSGMAGVISQIPFVGAAINEVLTELAFKRVYQRMVEMFEQMGKRIGDLGEEKIDREWFRSEQFQTLLFEAIHQLNVTHDRQKLEMLGIALANSGSSELKADDRKELFIRLLRDLTPQHIAMLVDLLPSSEYYPLPIGPDVTAELRTRLQAQARWEYRPTITPKDDHLLIAQMLAGCGLVEEELRSGFKAPTVSVRSQRDAERALGEYVRALQQPPNRVFSLSELGRDFLLFVGLPRNHVTEAAQAVAE